MTGIKISLVTASLSTGLAGVTGIISESGGELAKALEAMSATGLLAFIAVVCLAYANSVTKAHIAAQADTNEILRKLVAELHDRPCVNTR